jgi:hypothetical protein
MYFEIKTTNERFDRDMNMFERFRSFEYNKGGGFELVSNGSLLCQTNTQQKPMNTVGELKKSQQPLPANW